jgi:K+-sensing histidine kinase KdpD
LRRLAKVDQAAEHFFGKDSLQALDGLRLATDALRVERLAVRVL